MTVAISLGGTSARLVTDDWHEEIGEGNDAAREYLSGLETLLGDIDSDAQYMGELWDGADPEGDESEEGGRSQSRGGVQEDRRKDARRQDDPFARQ